MARGAKFPRKFGPGGPNFRGAKFPVTPDCTLSGKKLKVVNEFKDLGVIMTSNLSWSNQVASSVKKANRILGLIKRTVGSFTPTSTFTTLYKSLVRPLLEYAAPVCSPHLVKDIQALEAVQRRASS